MTRWGVLDDEEAADEILKAWMESQPSGIEGRRQMPLFEISDPDMRALSEFLRWADQTDTQGWPPNGAGKGDQFMKYHPQQVAFAYIACALLLFAVQVLGGLLAGWVYVSPNFLSEILPFNIIRMIHTNALVFWLLLGFFGAAYYLVPKQAETELYSVKLAYLQLFIIMVGTLRAVGSYLMAILDRLLHRSNVLNIRGRSYRLRDLEGILKKESA